ncbi:glycoside hydrolase family 3 N-terminal domain-containing protein [Microbacterium sp.]|uniref:glycoside hydrolase family 3 N-terminal domain-containing protein n=1 Tax=Microbacterium sp. TaxID=51671 RepID=UPI0025F84437|nr:glycoside hydrolase family 3 N-terminal domain-containing protein [Microbacterium sp.]
MRHTWAVLAVGVLALSGCTSAAPAPSPTASHAPTSARTPTPTPDPVSALTLEQEVGQLFMVGTGVTSAMPETLSAVSDRHVGSIFLHGRTRGGAGAVAPVVAQFSALVAPQTTGGIPLWVATDQEGGEVQVIRGPGVDDIPYAIRQADDPASVLQRNARHWGEQLAAASVDMNLAPVADIVTSHDTRFDNPPIGALGRQYGYDARTVSTAAGAFADGMRAAGILPTFKHFPGLGRVSANTDTAANVVDDVIGVDSPDVAAYRGLIAAGPCVVMISTAVYSRIDGASPAALSSAVVTGLLREQVGFTGVVMTDDLSAAAQVQAIPPGDRAVRAIEAGVDLVLVSADPSVLPAMYDAALARAQSDPAFALQVEAAAARVLAAKSWRD